MSEQNVGASGPLPYILADGLAKICYEGYVNRLAGEYHVPEVGSAGRPLGLDTFRAQAMEIPNSDPTAFTRLNTLFTNFTIFIDTITSPPRGNSIVSGRDSRGSSLAPGMSAPPSRTTTASTTPRKSSSSAITIHDGSSLISAGPNAAGGGGVGFKRPQPDSEYSRDHQVLQARLSALNDASIAREFEQSTSVEGKVFSPTMLEMCSFTEQSEKNLEQLIRSILNLDSTTAMPANPELTSSPLHPKLARLLAADDQNEVREAITPILVRLRSSLSNLGRTMARAHKLFWIANHTEHGNWSVVSQIITRERWDEEQKILDPTGHKPLSTWPEKMAAALTACGYTTAVDKNGALIGPVSPEARKLLHASKGPGRDRNVSFRTGGRGAAAGGASSSFKKGNRANSAQRGSGKGKTAGKRSSQARKPDAWSGTPSSASAPAAAPPPP